MSGFAFLDFFFPVRNFSRISLWVGRDLSVCSFFSFFVGLFFNLKF